MVRILLFIHHHLVAGCLAHGKEYGSLLDFEFFIGMCYSSQTCPRIIILISVKTEKPTADSQDPRDQEDGEGEKKRATA